MEPFKTYIYEQAQLEKFEREILSGFLTESKLMEMYDKGELSEAEIAIAEGFFDRLKARGAQALGAVRGLGQRVAGGVNRAVGQAQYGAGSTLAKYAGGDKSKSPLVQKGLERQRAAKAQIQQGKETASNQKYVSYVNNTVNTLVNDLKKLNIPITNESQLINDLYTAITNNTTIR